MRLLFEGLTQLKVERFGKVRTTFDSTKYVEIYVDLILHDVAIVPVSGITLFSLDTPPCVATAALPASVPPSIDVNDFHACYVHGHVAVGVETANQLDRVVNLTGGLWPCFGGEEEENGSTKDHFFLLKSVRFSVSPLICSDQGAFSLCVARCTPCSSRMIGRGTAEPSLLRASLTPLTFPEFSCGYPRSRPVARC